MITRLLPQPVELDINGTTYKFAQLRIGEIARIQAWLDSLPNPIAVIRPMLDGLTPDERKAMLIEAQKELRNWPPQYGTQKGLEMIGRPEGTRIFMRAALKRCQNHLTDTQCDEITESMELDALAQVIEIASTGKLSEMSSDQKK